MVITQAAVLRSHDTPFELMDVTLADPRPHEVLIRVVGAGMCHTDQQPRHPEQLGIPLPIVLGHEGSGIVEEVGADVVGVEPGDHVVASFASCGTCASCLRGAPAYCAVFELGNLTGLDADGAASATAHDGSRVANRWFGQSTFARHALVAERSLVVVDRSLPLELLGPLGCGFQTGAGSVLNEMRLVPGQSVVVFGAGAVGLGGVMAAKLSGASEIVVVDRNTFRLDIARELGATRTVVVGDRDLTDAVRGPAAAAFDFTLETTAAAEPLVAAVRVLDRPGKVVYVGGGTSNLTIAPYELVGRHATFVFEGSAVPRLFLPRLIDFWKAGSFPFDRVVRTYPLEEINTAEADSLAGGTIKPVLIP